MTFSFQKEIRKALGITEKKNMTDRTKDKKYGGNPGGDPSPDQVEQWRINNDNHEIDLVSILMMLKVIIQTETKSSEPGTKEVTQNGRIKDAIGQVKFFREYLIRMHGREVNDFVFIPIIAFPRLSTLPSSKKRSQCYCKNVNYEDTDLQRDAAKEAKTQEICNSVKSLEAKLEWEVAEVEELMRRAIQNAQLQLKLDKDTLGDGNCFSRAMVQQFQRPQIKHFLQNRGLAISSFMQLKEKVEEFVRTHMHTDKMKVLKDNFEMSQSNMTRENPDLEPRSWSKYWSDMLKDGEWADDTYIQACAWYLNMNIVVVYAGHATPERPFYPMEGNFSSERTGPTLLVGYINGNHYQSLLPLQEDQSRPEYLAQPAIDNTLQSVLQALGLGDLEKVNQGSQVSS